MVIIAIYTHEVDTMKEKKIVFCFACGNEFLSSANRPLYSECGSTKVIDSNKAGSRKEMVILQRKVAKLDYQIQDLAETVDIYFHIS
jgi:hypothetical protein